MSTFDTSFDQYLEQLRQGLEADPACDDIVDEIRDHLLEARASYVDAGTNNEFAESRVLDEFGDPQRLAAGFRPLAPLRHSREMGGRLRKLCPVVPAVVAIAFLLDDPTADHGAILSAPGFTAVRVGVALMLTGLCAVGAATFRQRPWSRTAPARRLLAVCVASGWLITTGSMLWAGGAALHLALLLGLPEAMLWGVGASVIVGLTAVRLTRSFAGSRLLLCPTQLGLPALAHLCGPRSVRRASR